jgi:hypothetical protein
MDCSCHKTLRHARLLALVCVAVSGPAGADCQLAAAGQLRVYQHEGRVAGSYDSLASTALELDCDQRFFGGAQALSTRIFARAAQHGSARSYADVRELVWNLKHDSLQLRAGVDQVFWGVTEFAHLVDIINQSDLLEHPTGAAKVGQPMASVSVRQRWGALTLFAMPWFREREYPDLHDRLRLAPPLQFGSALFESDRGRGHFDWALRYSHVIGPLDLGLSYFDGTSRDPLRVFTSTPAGLAEMHAYYPQISQAGIDAQLTLGAWMLKFEGAQRHVSGATREAHTLGIEYALVGIGGTPADLNMVLEYVHDARRPSPVTDYLDDDWSAGFRLAFNDERSTDAKFGVIYDPDLSSQGLAFDMSTRIAGQWRLAGEMRLFRRVAPSDPLRALDGEDYIDISLTRYF